MATLCKKKFIENMGNRIMPMILKKFTMLQEENTRTTHEQPGKNQLIWLKTRKLEK